MKRILILLFLPLFSFAENELNLLNDSLRSIYKNGIQDTNQGNALAEFIHRNNAQLTQDTAFKYLDKLYTFSKNEAWTEGLYISVFKKLHYLGCDSKHKEALNLILAFMNDKEHLKTENIDLKIELNLGVANILNAINKINYTQSRADSIGFFYKKVVGLINTINEKTKFHGLAYYYCGNYYDGQDNYEAAIEYYQKALAVFKLKKDSLCMGDCYNEMANVYYYQNNYHLSLKYHRIGLKLFTAIKDSFRIANSHNNIGNIYKDLLEEQKAINYYNKALTIYKTLQDTFSVSLVFNNLSLPYHNLKSYDKALDFLFKSIKIKKQINDISGLSQSYSNVANIYIEQEKYESSLSYSEKALDLARKNNKANNEAVALINMGIAYLNLNQKVKGKKYLSQGLIISKEFKFFPLEKEVYENLYAYYLKQQNYKKALEYYQLFEYTDDSITNSNYISIRRI